MPPGPDTETVTLAAALRRYSMVALVWSACDTALGRTLTPLTRTAAAASDG